MGKAPSSSRRGLRWRLFFALVGAIACLTLSLPLALGFLAPLHPFFDSLSHFRAHLAVALACTAALLLALRFWREGVMALVFALGAFATTSAAWPGTSSHAEEPNEAPLYRLLHLNLRFNNSTPQEVLALIQRIAPDVIALNEVSEAWRGHLRSIEQVYSHMHDCPTPSGMMGTQ